MIWSMHDASALTSLCTLGLGGYQAAAVSIATVDADGLRYVAAAGAGADKIVGTRMAAGQGIAGFVAATGQSLTVRDVISDPRFARDIGERTGYVPSAIQCLPVLDDEGEVIAVVSILDRQRADSSGSAGWPGDVDLGVHRRRRRVAGVGAERGRAVGDGDRPPRSTPRRRPSSERLA